MAPKDEEKAVKIAVESKDPKKKDSNKSNTKPEPEEPTMSEEDQELKERLETCVSTLINKDNEQSVTIPLRIKALDVIVDELKSATSSMTSVPKPLKFLRPHFLDLKLFYETLTGEDYILLRARLADVLSVLAMTMSDTGMSIEYGILLHFTLLTYNTHSYTSYTLIL